MRNTKCDFWGKIRLTDFGGVCYIGFMKLTRHKVMVLKTLLGFGVPVSVAAKEFGVSREAVSRIKSGKTWKNVPSAGITVQGLLLAVVLMERG